LSSSSVSSSSSSLSSSSVSSSSSSLSSSSVSSSSSDSSTIYGYAASVCDCSPIPSTDVYIAEDVEVSNGVFLNNGSYFYISTDDSHPIVAVPDGDIVLESIPDEYNSCWEGVNEVWIDSKTVYEVRTAQDLQDMSNDLDGCYRLMNDINLSGFSWTPIGTNLNNFTGNLDGQCYAIYNLTKDDTSATGFSLFGYCTSSKIRNVGMEGVYLNVETECAPLAFEADTCDFTNCYTKGEVHLQSTTVSQTISAGGFIYKEAVCNFSQCYAEVDITAAATGSGTRYRYIGGFVGFNASFTASNYERCYSSGNITINGAGSASDYAGYNGGFMGIETSNVCTFLNCYSNVNIYTNDVSVENIYVGQFIGRGYLYNAGLGDKLSNCYANGYITNPTATYGGFLGNATSWNDYHRSYYNSDKGPTSNPARDVALLTTEEMGVQDNFVGWDFEMIWVMYDGFPVLRKYGETDPSSVDRNPSVVGDFIGDCSC